MTLVLRSELRFASSFARAPASCSRTALPWAIDSSSAFCEMNAFSTSFCWLAMMRSAFATSASSRAISALSDRLWISRSEASISARGSPRFTFLPTNPCTLTTRPATSAPTFGSMKFSSDPTESSTTSSVRTSALATVTSVGGGPACFLVSALLSPQPAASAARAIAARESRRFTGRLGWVPGRPAPGESAR